MALSLAFTVPSRAAASTCCMRHKIQAITTTVRFNLVCDFNWLGSLADFGTEKGHLAMLAQRQRRNC